MSKNVRSLSSRKGLEDNLFEHLAKVREESEGLDKEALRSVADRYLVGNANVYGTTTFYDFLNPEKSNKKVFACAGSACMLAGTQKGLCQSLEQHFQASEIGEVYCLGRCYENNAFHYKGLNYSGNDIDQIGALKSGSVRALPDSYRVGHLGKGLLTAGEPSLDACVELLQRLLESDRDALLEEVNASGLRGRGGAGFPLGIKLAGVKKEQADQKYIVCNADEGDPGAFSDRYLMEQKPHLVLFGMAIAGYMSGAQDGVLYIRAEYPESIEITKKAMEPFNRLSRTPNRTAKPLSSSCTWSRRRARTSAAKRRLCSRRSKGCGQRCAPVRRSPCSMAFLESRPL
jgi:NADH:ubiquinone oxidoreductase, NADH-binding (51 kD) subunit